MNKYTSVITSISKRVFSKRIFILAVATWAFCVVPAATTRADAGPIVLAPVTKTKPITDVLEVIPMRITAYSSTPDQTDSTPFITANGTRVHDGIVATNLLPFGTEIEIPALFGDKIFTVEDRTARRIKNTVDIWMTSKRKALIFGVSHTDIVVIKKNSGVGTEGALAEK